jgi:hypothetical protein
MIQKTMLVHGFLFARMPALQAALYWFENSSRVSLSKAGFKARDRIYKSR